MGLGGAESAMWAECGGGEKRVSARNRTCIVSRPACSTAIVLMYSVTAFGSALRLCLDVAGVKCVGWASVLPSAASSCHSPLLP
jgi:hypothetical protein